MHFFSGIQASSPDMRYSGDAYYDESSLMDDLKEDAKDAVLPSEGTADAKQSNNDWIRSASIKDIICLTEPPPTGTEFN